MSFDSHRVRVLGLLAPLAACVPPEGAPTTETDPDTGSESSTGEPPSECAAPTSGPTMAADVTGDATWTADLSPYIVDHDIAIRATLTLEPCTEILVGASHVITVADAGRVVGMGTESQPIHIGALEGDAPWGNIRLYNGGPLDLAYTVIEGGGELGNTVPLAAAMIDAQAVDAADPGALRFDHVTVRGSVSQGIVLRDGARFSTDSSELVATDNASHPVNMWASGVSTLPSGDYTGNGVDAIFLIGGGMAKITEDATIHDRGVRYIVGEPSTGTELLVAALPGAPAPALTIEPGVTLAFGTDGALHVDYGASEEPAHGALVAVGTADAPITFTSSAESPAAGDWFGIYIWNEPDARDAIDHAVVEYAGGTSQIGSSACPWSGIQPNDGAIRLLGEPPPSGEIVTNTLVRDSAGHGIDRGWVGDPIDYQATNTFESIAFCLESYPHPTEPTVCPDPAPCPQ